MITLFILLLALSLGALFAVSAIHKLSGLTAFFEAVRDYRLLPPPLLWPTAIMLPLVELGAAGLIFVDLSIGLAAAAGLLLLYGSAIAINLGRGRTQIDCGCLGPNASGRRIHWAMVARNWLLATGAIASYLVIPSTPANHWLSLSWLEYVTLLAGTLSLAVLYWAFEYVTTFAARIEARS